MKNLNVSICAYGTCKRPGCGGQPYDLRQNLESALALVRQAAAEGADIAILPETFAVQNAADWMSRAEPLDGYVVSTLSQEAKRLEIGIAAGQMTCEDNCNYNSIVLLNRGGDIAAVYHKVYPTIGELEEGIAPGDGPLVADTEFGRLGFAVCFDLNFAELRLGYRDLQPDLIVFCSAFRGGLQARWWAYETRSYVVTSCIDPESAIINPLGRVVARTDDWTRSVTSTLNLDYRVLHYDYTNRSLDDARSRYGKDFDFEWSEREGVMLISAKGEMSVGALIKAMGWEEVEDYFARARDLRQQALDGRAIQRGPRAW